MDLVLKDIKLPKDPLDSDQEVSGEESPHEPVKRMIQKRFDDMKKEEHSIPQN